MKLKQNQRYYFCFWFWVVLLLLVASHSPRKMHCWTCQVHPLRGLESKVIFISHIKLRGTSFPLHHGSLERASVAHSLKTPGVFVQLIVRYCQGFDMPLIPREQYGFWSIWELVNLLWCVVVFCCLYVEQMFEGFSGWTLPCLNAVGHAQWVRNFLEEMQAHVFFTYFSNAKPFFPRKSSWLTLYEVNCRPWHTFSPKCLWCRDCRLRNVWGRDLSFSLVMWKNVHHRQASGESYW